jgi:RNA polymerase sigma factor (sigma-70 family)
VTILEFYRDHRLEIEILDDTRALFVLTFIGQLGNTSRAALSLHLGWAGEELDGILKRLTEAQLVRDTSKFNPENPIRLAPSGLSMIAALNFPRKDERFKEIRNILLSERSRVIAVHGLGGAGKSSLINALLGPVSVKEEEGDTDLLVKARAGDQQAAEDLFRKYRAYVQWVAQSLLRNDADAEDASQRTFFKLISGIPREVWPPIKPLLRTIARNTAIDMLREKFRHPEEPIERAEQQEEKDLISNWYREEQQAIVRQTYREILKNIGLRVESAEFALEEDAQLAYVHLRRAVAGLEFDERLLLWLRFWEGRSIEEIAEEFHISTATASRRLRYVRSRLRKQLEAALADSNKNPPS